MKMRMGLWVAALAGILGTWVDLAAAEGPVLVASVEEAPSAEAGFGPLLVRILVDDVEDVAVVVRYLTPATVTVSEGFSESHGLVVDEAGEGEPLATAGRLIEFGAPKPEFLPDGIYSQQVSIDTVVRGQLPRRSIHYRFFEVQAGAVQRLTQTQYDERTAVRDENGRLAVSPGPSVSTVATKGLLIESGDTGILSDSERGM